MKHITLNKEKSLLSIMSNLKHTGRYRRNAEIILLHCQGSSINKIAKKLNISRQTAYTYLKRFRMEGLEGLKTRYKPGPGAPCKYAQIKRQQIIDTVRKVPPSALKESYYPYSWSLKKIIKYLISIKIIGNISKSTLWRILTKQGQLKAVEKEYYNFDFDKIPLRYRYEPHLKNDYEYLLKKHADNFEIRYMQYKIWSHPNGQYHDITK